MGLTPVVSYLLSIGRRNTRFHAFVNERTDIYSKVSHPQFITIIFHFPASSSMSTLEMNVAQNNDLDVLVLELNCPICLHLFSNPASLPCGHTYCFACLRTMGEGLDQHRCPECQTEFSGVEDLVKNFKMCSIVESYRAASVGEEPKEDLPQGSQTDGHGSEGRGGFQVASGSLEQPCYPEQTDKARKEMDESKIQLASKVKELNLKLEMAESLLTKEQEREMEATTNNNQLRKKISGLLGQMENLLQSYCTQVMQLLEEELVVGEADLSGRVRGASETTKQLRQTVLRAESLLTKQDRSEYHQELQTLQPHIVELLTKPVGEEKDHPDMKFNPTQGCPKLEKMSTELRERIREIQRSLQNIFNPSEVTFDPETAHPNLILSDDLKTVTFSTTKQPYPLSPLRFSNFFQVLSTQTFAEGDHCWEVELEGSPWIIGICYGGKLERSGLASALESSQNSWCLMWFNNLLTAFERSHSVPLKRTTVSRRLEIRLSFKTQRLSFYNISPISGNTHVYTFNVNLTEPVHLAYRMMSGHPKAHVTIYSCQCY